MYMSSQPIALIGPLVTNADGANRNQEAAYTSEPTNSSGSTPSASSHCSLLALYATRAHPRVT
jgi:hypothetical protein